jgi:hypothetical protein
VYHLAFARAERTAGRHPRNVPYHQWCWQKYSSTPDPACQQLGTDGDRLKRRRHKADYDRADYARLDDEVTRALEEARQFRIDLAAIDPAHPLP